MLFISYTYLCINLMISCRLAQNLGRFKFLAPYKQSGFSLSKVHQASHLTNKELCFRSSASPPLHQGILCGFLTSDVPLWNDEDGTPLIKNCTLIRKGSLLLLYLHSPTFPTTTGLRKYH